MEHRFARVAVFLEVFREAAFGAREADEVIDFVRLGFDVEIRFLARIALEAEARGGLVALSRRTFDELMCVTQPNYTCGGAIDAPAPRFKIPPQSGVVFGWFVARHLKSRA